MPAKSKSQQRFFGMVRAAQKGELKNPSKRISQVAASISVDDAKDFAKTKHDGLPKKIKAAEALLPAVMQDQLRAQQQMALLQQQQQQQVGGRALQQQQQPTGGFGTGGPQGAANALGPPALSGKLGNGPGANMHAGNQSGGYKVASDCPKPPPKVKLSPRHKSLRDAAAGLFKKQAQNGLLGTAVRPPQAANPAVKPGSMLVKSPMTLGGSQMLRKQIRPVSPPAPLVPSGSQNVVNATPFGSPNQPRFPLSGLDVPEGSAGTPNIGYQDPADPNAGYASWVQQRSQQEQAAAQARQKSWLTQVMNQARGLVNTTRAPAAVPPVQPTHAMADLYPGLSGEESAYVGGQGRMLSNPDAPSAPAPPPPPIDPLPAADPNWGKVKDEIAPEGSLYAGLDREQANEVMSQGQLPDPIPAAPPPAAAAAPPPAPAPAPVGKYQHVIDDTQRLIDKNRQLLASGGLSPARAATLQRGIASAEQRIKDYQSRNSWSPDQLRSYALSNAVGPGAAAGAERAVDRALASGGQMDWHQQRSNNLAAGKPEFEGITRQSPQLLEQLAALPQPTPAGGPVESRSSLLAGPTRGSSEITPEARARFMQQFPGFRQFDPTTPEYAREFPDLARYHQMQDASRLVSQPTPGISKESAAGLISLPRRSQIRVAAQGLFR